MLFSSMRTAALTKPQNPIEGWSELERCPPSCRRCSSSGPALKRPQQLSLRVGVVVARVRGDVPLDRVAFDLDPPALLVLGRLTDQLLHLLGDVSLGVLALAEIAERRQRRRAMAADALA